MNKNIIHKARVLLIETGKMLPFVVCFVVVISYTECLCSLLMESYAEYENSVVLNKPISWFIGQYFEYNVITLIILLTISVAVETCVWNKLAIVYLAIQLAEKEYFITVELYPEYVYAIVIANIIVSGFFVWKGIKILCSKC